MTAETRDIPLLTLPAVLFPGTFLPMRVRQETQRLLLHGCADAQERVGVLLDSGGPPTRGGNFRTTGCLASVALLLSDESEQVSTILYGEQRMRVVEFTRQEPYLAGRVEMLDDYPGPHAERRGKQASDLFQHYLELIRRRYQVEVSSVTFPNDPNMVSYMLAAVLHLPLDTKQRWLEAASAAYRLDEELAFLRAECEKHAAFLSLSQQTNRRYLPPPTNISTPPSSR